MNTRTRFEAAIPTFKPERLQAEIAWYTNMIAYWKSQGRAECELESLRETLRLLREQQERQS